MRTTVTLEPDVERMLKEEAHRTRMSFKAVLNNAVRAGLCGAQPSGRRDPFVVEASPMRLRPGIDPVRPGEIADDLEVDAFRAVTEKLQSRLK